MLHEFLTANHDELVKRCDAKVAQRLAPPPTSRSLALGISQLITQLAETLREEESAAPTPEPARVPVRIKTAAGKHGGDLLRNGYTLEQVVHDYGDLCQALTELADERKAAITVQEFHTFNRCLDVAIAESVTEFARLRDHRVTVADTETMNDRLILLAGELRTSVNSAMLAFNAIKTGGVSAGGATGRVLDRSLTRLSDIIERTLTETRIHCGTVARPELIVLDTFLEQVSVFAVIEATARGQVFEVTGDRELHVEVDPQLLSSAISILLQNALRFTPRGGHITLRAKQNGERVVIAVEDGCNGLTPATLQELHGVLENPQIAIGSGVATVRVAVETAGGELHLDNVEHVGCVFSVGIFGAPNAGTYS
ncbi:MAG: HAMP domain-containing sensor histidine kinase [Kofleriaceae bacterium]